MGLEFDDSPVEARFEAYVDRLGTVLGHADRLTPFGGYVSGLLLPVARKSVNGGAKLVHPGGAKLVHLTLCCTRCWGVVPVVHRRDPRCFE